MQRVDELEAAGASMETLVELTSAFEGIASMRIAQIKDQVLQSTKFFDQLWGIYTQIKINEAFSFGRAQANAEAIIPKTLFIIITAEGGFSGDIDQQLVKLMLKDYNKDKVDIVVIGHHGAMQLSQYSVVYKKYYKLPARDRDINVTPITDTIKNYVSAKVFYPEYVSLMSQDVKSIEMAAALTERSTSVDDSKDVINEDTYIFEPSTIEVVAHLENSMMQIVLSQLILESKLAQYASRFKAMTAAHERADDMKKDIVLNYNRAKRAVKDERLKEIINGLKKVRATGRV